MRTIALLLIFLASLLIITDVYEGRVAAARADRRVVYRYVPRSALDEQYYGTPASARFQSMFATPSPWDGTKAPQAPEPEPAPDADLSDSEADDDPPALEPYAPPLVPRPQPPPAPPRRSRRAQRRIQQGAVHQGRV